MKLGLLVAAIVSTTAMATLPSAFADEADGSYNWSGFYVGTYGGMSWDSGRENDFYALQSFGNPSDPWGASVSGNSFAFGGIMGVNYQFGNGFVAGTELDLGKAGNASGRLGDSFGTDPATAFNLNGGLTGSGRLRLGYAAGRFMPFVTGGVAYEGFGIDVVDNYDCAPGGCAGQARFSGDGQAFGFSVGAGLNYAISDNIIMGAEYRYSKFGPSVVGAANQALGQTRDYQMNLNESSARATITLKF
jgi:outer membrane immunogenic protein